MKNFIVKLTLMLLFNMVSIGYAVEVDQSTETRRAVPEFVSEPEAPRWVGQAAPDIKLAPIKGFAVLLSKVIGRKVVILHYFTTLCETCDTEKRDLTQFYQRMKEKNILMYGINVGEGREAVEEFISRNNLPYPIVLDDGPLVEAFDIETTPTTIVIGADGRVKLFHETALLNANEELMPVVKEELMRLRQK